jgi:sirohydrochlorin ferrochelatase
MGILLAVCFTVGCNSSDTTSTVNNQAEKASSNEPEAKESEAKEKKIGVLIVSHGSRSKSWSKMLLDIEDAIGDDVLKDGQISGLRSAFMEYREPTISDQLKEFDKEGYTDVILVPLLLTVSSHSFDDIPTIIGQKQDRLSLEKLRQEGIEVYTPKANVTIAPLLDFPAILGKNVVRRTKEMSKTPEEEGVVMVAYGSEPYEAEWTQLLDKTAKEVRKATGVDCVEYCWCGHIVRYKSEPTEKAIQKVLKEKQRALVIPVLVAVDETFQGKIIGGAIKNVNQNERIAYRSDAILPDDNVNQWIVDISHKLAGEIAASKENSEDMHQE